MAKQLHQTSTTVINIVLLIFIGVVVYQVWTYYQGQNNQIEPFTSSLTYKSQNPQLNSSASASAGQSRYDTSDIYANVPLASNQADKFQAGLRNSGNVDPNTFNLSQTDSDNHFDFASLAGLTKTAKSNSSKKLSSAPEYTSTEDMLPAQDMSNVTLRDPMDSDNFMYTRNIFAPTQSRRSQGGDPIRGDLYLVPIQRGIGDVFADPQKDLTKGLFQNYNDLQEETNIQDKIYTNLASGNQTQDPDILAAAQNAATQISQPNLKFARFIN